MKYIILCCKDVQIKLPNHDIKEKLDQDRLSKNIRKIGLYTKNTRFKPGTYVNLVLLLKEVVKEKSFAFEVMYNVVVNTNIR